MSKGYFDDFRSFRDSKGKIFEASKELTPTKYAPVFPATEVGQKAKVG